MNLEKRKLTDYQKAELWSEIGLCATQLHNNKQNSPEFYKTVDHLVELQMKLKWHEVAETCQLSKTE